MVPRPSRCLSVNGSKPVCVYGKCVNDAGYTAQHTTHSQGLGHLVIPTWSVQRRYSQFRQLRSVLAQTRPSTAAFAFPKKRVQLNAPSVGQVTKRQVMLQTWLQQVCDTLGNDATEQLKYFLDVNVGEIRSSQSPVLPAVTCCIGPPLSQK